MEDSLDLCFRTLGGLLKQREQTLQESNPVLQFEQRAENEKRKRRKLVQLEERCGYYLQAIAVLIGREQLEKAMSLCSRKGSIIRYRCRTSGRSCYNVNGQLEAYVIFDQDETGGILFCSCYSFAQRYDQTQPYCKHLVALRLSTALGNCLTVEVDDSEFAIYLNK
mmetsp:Transcript_1438/g.1721  ORF Transcript_1438/g.1721 Transcript_1438/m.1721 type:complete len:166 (-) Transcript_1438:191-688(-)